MGVVFFKLFLEAEKSGRSLTGLNKHVDFYCEALTWESMGTESL